MRSFTVAVTMAGVVALAAVFGSSGVAVAAPKDYCADLKGVSTGSTCKIYLSEAGYSVDITFPLNYPDLQPMADFIAQKRDSFVNTAKSGAPGTTPYALSIMPTSYTSAIPPRGTQAVVLAVTQNVVGATPETTYKSFNWDQSYRKAIIWTAAPDDKANTPLWRVADPLTTVGPIVKADLEKQLAPPPPAAPPGEPGEPVAATPTSTTPVAAPPLPIATPALYNPANYQSFAVVNDGIMFFFDQGVLLPDSYGPLQVLAPRSLIDPMIA